MTKSDKSQMPSDILIIDDNVEANSFLSQMLHDRGYAVDVTTRGEEGLERLSGRAYDLVLLDMDLPTIDGLDVLENMRQRNIDIPVLVISGIINDSSTVLAIKKMGVAGFYSKNDSSGKLLVMIEDVLKNHKRIPQKRIIVIDDNQSITEMLTEYLTPLGYEVFVFGSGKDILAHIQKYVPSIIFLDIILPGFDGIELLDQIRQLDQTVKIIMISGVEDEEICSQSIKKGADDFIRKPFSLEQLKICIDKNIPKPRAQMRSLK